jgi:guanine deaminase
MNTKSQTLSKNAGSQTFGKDFALKGNILYCENMGTILSFEKHYLVCIDGLVEGVYPFLPSQFAGIPVEDKGDQLIIPGLIDLHTHAPQFAYRGLGMDRELLDWLDTYAFPEEAKYSDLLYARKAYQIFADELCASATTRASIFATIHTDATILLMDLLEQKGMKAMVGKVNMDRNSPSFLCEESADASVKETNRWLSEISNKYKNISPILTPRYTPACSDSLMKELGALSASMGLPVQSHLSENEAEIAWVRELCPDTNSYAETYDRYSLLGNDSPGIMAHCVHLSQDELELLQKRNVYIAHCPESNYSLSSGAAPVRQFLDMGIKVGLGTDVAGGYSLSVFKAMADAILVSNLRWKLKDNTLKSLTISEVFYMATKGGGRFFGQVGSFEKGYEMDAVVLDDKNLPTTRTLSPLERLERLIFLSDNRNVADKYVAGIKVK